MMRTTVSWRSIPVFTAVMGYVALLWKPPSSIQTTSLPTKPPLISWKALLQAVINIAAALWIYWSALHGDWLWDDDLLVTNNSNLHSLRGLWEIWFSTSSTDYWPLTWTLLWGEWHLWGNAPLGFHLVSLALHISSGFLIWRLFTLLGLGYGWIGGLLFVIHPLTVESVAWISEIKNTLSLPFFLLSCNAWLDVEEAKRYGHLKSVLYYLAAMLAKTSTVMLPAVLLLYCWWKRGRISGVEIKRMIPFGAIALVLGLVTVYFQNNGGESYEVEIGGPGARLISASTALFFYIGKFVLPVDLLPIYQQWTLNPTSFVQELMIPLLTALLLGLWFQRKGWGRHMLFGFGFFLLNLLPVLGLVKMRYMNLSWVADHLSYLPIIGLIGIVVVGLEKVYERIPSSLKHYGIGMIIIWMGWLSWQSHNYAGEFVNEETLWTYTIQHNSNAWLAHYNLGNALRQGGRVPEAIEEYEQALRIKPDYAEAHSNLGNALLQVGQISEAIEQCEEALRIKPDLSAGHINLGVALFKKDRVPEAIEEYKQALQINQDNAAAHYNLGNALWQTGRVPEAIREYKQALRIKPDLVDAYINLGNAFLQTGRLPEAIEQYGAALRIKPDYAHVRYNLAKALALENAAP